MDEKIIPFPGSLHQGSGQAPFALSEERLARWKEGLFSSDYEKQWQTFALLEQLTEWGVLKLIETFLCYDGGDPLLKTKLLQALRQRTPWPITLPVIKGDDQLNVNIQEVPLLWEEWPVAAQLPIRHLEDTAGDEPTLVEMARELWLFGLEKAYPFLPEFTDERAWTAGLHYYTLEMIHPDAAQQQAAHRLAQIYGLDGQEVLEQAERVAAWLMEL